MVYMHAENEVLSSSGLETDTRADRRTRLKTLRSSKRGSHKMTRNIYWTYKHIRPECSTYFGTT